ncbi:gliding motility-associated C-terminal domain-containing protein [Chitinophaga oryzae]|uniref:Gliding motility-associated C-terminal domain-containing protein n=1 Tax=Chitinophaga oryzae TaxID=2725414 RepID=A0ABX6LB66_9BACT|nr:Ig-like domain-containing protein [Chitinophaga oryzae]QJB37184.1 gliding motility-associated C-terminal domain-containing protein [Chitinophaga oryzae]
MYIPTLIRSGWSCLLWCLLLALPVSAQFSVTDFSNSPLQTAITRDKFNNIYSISYNAGSSRSVITKYINGNPGNLNWIYESPAYVPDGGYYWGIAVNAYGDVYFTATDGSVGSGRIMRLRFNGAGYLPVETVRSGTGYISLAFDQQENLVVMEEDMVSGRARLMRYNKGNESGPGTVLYEMQDNMFTSYPTGLAVDKNNTIYFTGFWDFSNKNNIYRLKNGAAAPTKHGSGTFTSLTCDDAGYLYAVDAGSGSGTSGVIWRFDSEMLFPDYVQGGISATISNIDPPQLPWGIIVDRAASTIYYNQYTAPGIRKLTATPVTVTEMSLMTTSPGNVSSVRYKVTFNPNLTAPPPKEAFSVSTTGTVSGAAVTQVQWNLDYFTVDVSTGTGDGTLALVMNGTNMLNPVNSAPVTGAAYVIDRTPPSGTLTINNGAAYTNSTTVTLDITASDASPDMTMEFSNDAVAYSAAQPVTSRVSWTLPPGEGKKTVYMKVKDKAGNYLIIQKDITIDTHAPSVSFTAGPPMITTGTQAMFTFTAGEPATYEARLDGGTISSATSPLLLTGISVAPHVLEIRATDPAGNQSAWKPYSWTVETLPVVTGMDVPVNGYYNAGATLDFLVRYDVPVLVAGTPCLPLTIGAANVKALYTGGTGTKELSFRYTVVPGDEATDGISTGATLELNGGNIWSTGGADASLSLNGDRTLASVKIHTLPPSAALSVSQSQVNAPFTLTITFSEGVTGLAKEDIQISNGEVSNIVTANNILYTATVSNFNTGPIQISLPANAAVNAYNTGNTASNTVNMTADVTRPVVSQVAVPPNDYYHVADRIDFEVAYSENVSVNTTLGKPSLGITIGSTVRQAEYLSINSSNRLVFSYEIMPGDEDMDGITIDALHLNGSTVRDDAGNDADLTLNGVGNTTFVRVNTTPVSCILSMPKTAFNMPFLLTLSFSEPIVGLTVSDLSVLNTTVSSLAAVNDSTFTMLLTPTGERSYTVSLPSGTVTQKAGGNINLPSNTLTFTWDVTPPKVSSVAVPSGGYYGTGKSLEFYVTMDEPVTITGRPTLPVVIGSKTVLAEYISNTSGTVLLFRYIVQDGDTDLDGIAVGSGLSLNAGSLKDAAGNDALPPVRNVGSTSQVFVHTVAPTVTLSTTAISPLNHDFTITATFSERVDGLAATAFSATKADISNLQTTDNKTYTALVKPRESGAVIISLPAGAATNVAGTGNSASNTLNVTYDATPAEVSGVDVPSGGVYAAGSIMNFVVWYNEPVAVTGAPSLSLTIGNKVVQARYLNTAGDRVFFVYQVVQGDMDTDGITLDNTIQLNGGTIKDDAGNNADLTLRSIPATTGILVNTATPAVTLSADAASPVGSAFTITTTFSEVVTGLTGVAFQVTNGTISNLATADNRTYTATISPAADGIVTISLPAGAAKNNANTGNTTSNTLTLAYDATAPEITNVSVPGRGYYKAGTALRFTVNVSEPVTVTGGPSIPIIIGNETVQATYTGGSGTTALGFLYVVKDGDYDMDGIITGPALQLNGGTLKDAAGNNALLRLNNVGSTSEVLVNTRQPGVTLSSTAANPTTQAFPLTATFSEAVTGFTSDDMNAVNATITQLQTSDNITYTVLVTPVADGPVTVQIPANVVKSQSGNDNLASNVFSIQADMTAPVVTSVSVPSPGYYKAGQQLVFTLNMSEPVTATAATGLTVYIGGTVVPATLTGGTGTATLEFSCTVQDGFMDMDGITLGRVLNGTVKDIAGNVAGPILVNIGNTSGVFVNTQHPTVSVATPAVSPVRQSFPVTITFSERVTGFTANGITVTNATVSQLQTTDNIIYTTTITPAADGAITVQVPAGAAQNIGLNDNIASNLLSLQAKITAPVVARIDVPGSGYYRAGQPLNFSVHLSEPVSVTGTPSIPVIIGNQTVQAIYTGGTGTATLQFRYTVQQGDMDLDGISVGSAIVLNGGALKDAAGNNANLALMNIGNASGVLVNTQHPAAVISTTAVSPVRQAFLLTITFSEAVTGFTASGITATNATVSQLQTTDNITYTVLITPSADGSLSLRVPSGVAQNKAGNDNQSSNTIGLTADITVPAVTRVDVPANGAYKAGQPLNFSVYLSEPVSVTGTPSIPVIIGNQTVQAIYTGGTGTASLQFRYTVQQGDMDLDGISVGNAIVLNGGALKDAAGNNANPALMNIGNTSGVLVNTQHPAAVISTTAVSPVRQAFPLTITFSEAVTGFTASGITATNATVSQLQTTDNITYTVLITPSADGSLSLRVPSGVAQNKAGNDNQSSNTIGLTADITVPAVTRVNVPANGAYKAGQPLDFSVYLSEPVSVTGTPSIPVIIGNQTVQAIYTGGTGTATLQFRYTVQQGDMDLDGISVGNAIVLNGGALKDAAGNNAAPALHQVPATDAILVKTNRPGVTLSSGSQGRINTPFTVNLAFTDAVRGLAVTGIQVNNGVASQLQTTDNIHYTVLITPAADGQVIVQLPADVASDIAGNGNLASGQLDLTYDATAPVIRQQSFDINDNSPAGAVVGQLQGTDASGTVQGWTLVTDGSGGALSLAANGRITVKDNTLLRAVAGKTITLQVTASDGLNTSAAVPVTVNVRISYVNKQPVMDPVADVYLCATTEAQTIQLTGVSPVEPDQHYTISLASSQPYFDVLKADVAANTIRYQLKPGVGSGSAVVTITLKDDGGTANGGKDTYSQTFFLTVNALPAVSISSDKGGTISKGDVVTLTATGAAAYSWKPAAGANGSLQEPTLTVKPPADATYQVTGTSAAGCSASATISIRVTDDYKLDATNLLTPNGDGKNDRWTIRNLDSYPDNEVKIFDRAGRLVYQRRNYSNDWDGTLNGHPLAEGTYYYVLTVNGTSRVWKGFITIIRNDQ